MSINPTPPVWFLSPGATVTTTTVEMQYYEATGTSGNTPIYTQFFQRQTGTSTWVDATIQNPSPTANNEKVNAQNFINSVTYTGLSFNTQYDFKFRFRDSTLPTNQTTLGYSAVRTYTTTTPADPNPPDDPSNLTAGTITENTIQLNWDGSNDAIYGITGLKYYIEFRTAGVGSFVPNTNPSNFYLHTGNAYSAQTATLTGLSPFTQYEFRVYAQDPAGNDSGTTNTLTTQTTDTTDPTAPTNLNASGTTSTTTNLSWTAATDNVGVTAYKIYQDGLSLLNIPASATPSHTVTGLTANTNYSFYVSAFDGANNESIFSNTINVLTNNLPTPTPTGSGTTDNLTYIKIPKLDANGNNNSSTLSQLSFLSIPSSNGDKADFNVIGISENPYFYTYTAIPASGSKIDNSATGSIQYRYTENLTASFSSYPGMSSVAPINLCNSSTTVINSNRAIQRISQGTNQGARINTLQEKPIQITASIDISTTNTTNNYYIGIFSASYSGNTRTGLGLITSSLAFQGNNNITLTTEAFIPINQYVFAGWFRTSQGATSFGVLATGSMIISSSEITGNFNQSTLEPFLKFKFQNSDAEVLLNNANQYSTNKFLQDLDYSTSTTVAINYPQILLGSASKGTVPRSYYTSLSSLIPKYIGAKNQSSDFNVYNPLAGLLWDRVPTNVGTFGQLPSVDSKDNTIVEFDWAGGTSPEIPFGGSFKLANLILEVSDISSVRSVNPGTNVLNQTIYNYIWSGSDTTYNASASFIEERDDYYNVLNNSYPVGSQLVPIQYASTGTPVLPKVAEIIETTIEAPSISIYGGSGSYRRNPSQPTWNYFIWQQDHNYLTIQKYNGGSVSYAKYPSFTVFGPDYSTSTSEPVLELQGNSNNFESSFLFEINNKLVQGERWFITLFNDFEFPVNVDNPNQVFRKITDGANPPLNSIGVFEIKGITFSGGGNPTVGTDVGTGNIKIMFDPKTKNTSGKALFAGDKAVATAGIGNLGFLIWKSSKNYQEVSTIVNKNTSQVTAGGFMSTTTTDLNTNNFNSITRQFGNNTSN